MTRTPTINLKEARSIVEAMREAKIAKDVARLLTIYHDDCVLEQPGLGVLAEGKRELALALMSFVRSFPDYRRSEDGYGFSDETYISWGTATFTLTGSFEGRVPNSEPVSVMTFVLFRFCDGRIVYEGHHWDTGRISMASGIPLSALLAKSNAN